jgi:hypothetical protein
MDYSAAAQRGQGQQRSQDRREGTQQPLYHLPYLFQKTVIIDVKSVKPTATRNELADFVLQCLPVQPMDVVSVYTDHVSQHLFVTVDTDNVFESDPGRPADRSRLGRRRRCLGLWLVH